MRQIPAALLEGLDGAGVECAQRWWCMLPARTRDELTSLFDARLDTCKQWHDTGEDGEATDAKWRRVPVQVRGRMVDPNDDSINEEWRADYFEFLLSHPEIVINSDLTRTFYTGCTAHADARAALKAGVIPADFVCPFSRGECPMHAMLQLVPGMSVKLEWIAAPDSATA